MYVCVVVMAHRRPFSFSLINPYSFCCSIHIQVKLRIARFFFRALTWSVSCLLVGSSILLFPFSRTHTHTKSGFCYRCCYCCALSLFLSLLRSLSVFFYSRACVCPSLFYIIYWEYYS